MLKFLKKIALLLTVILASQSQIYAQTEYDNNDVQQIEVIKGSISSCFSFARLGPDDSTWTGLIWNDDQPRRLVGLELPPSDIDNRWRSFWTRRVIVEKFKNLETISLNNLTSHIIGSGAEAYAISAAELKNLPRLRSLTLVGSRMLPLVSFSSLPALPNLRELSLTNLDADLSEYTYLVKIKGLESLTLESTTIDDLYYLKDMTSLKNLRLIKTGNRRSGSIFKPYSMRIAPLRIGYLDNLRLEKLALRSNNIIKIEGLEKQSSLEELDLSSNQIIKIEGLEKQSSLEKLDLSSNQIEETCGLNSLSSLQTLLLNKNIITNITGLGSLKRLQVLNLTHNKLTLTTGLEGLVSLKELYLKENLIKEISNLESLTQLEVLDLTDNKITEISGLDSLVNLQTLKLGNNSYSEIRGLEKLINLKELELGGGKEIRGLESLTKLERLTIPGRWFTEVKGLGNNKSLIYLDLSGNPIVDLKGLTGLDNLSYLNLYYNHLPDLTTMPQLINLRELDLSSSQNLVNLEGIERLKNLEKFDLSNSEQLSDFSALARLPHLKELKYSYLEYKFPGLPGLKSDSLTDLELINNDLVQFPDLQMLPVLEKLDLSNNKISKFDSITPHNKLKELNLSVNLLGSAQPLLKAFPSLESLILTRSNLNETLDLSNSTKLMYLDLRDNQIPSITGWASLPDLAVIELANNAMPLSFLRTLMLDSKQSGRQWRFGAKQINVFGHITMAINETLDLSAEYSFDGATTRFKVDKIDGTPKTIIETIDYNAEDDPLRRDSSCSNSRSADREPKVNIYYDGYKFDKGKIAFSEPGKYKISMYNENIYFCAPSKARWYKDKVVNVVSGVITVR